MSESGNHCRVDGSERLLHVIVELLLVELLHWAGNHPLVKVGLGDRPDLLDGCTKRKNRVSKKRDRRRMAKDGPAQVGQQLDGPAKVGQQQDGPARVGQQQDRKWSGRSGGYCGNWEVWCFR